MRANIRAFTDNRAEFAVRRARKVRGQAPRGAESPFPADNEERAEFSELSRLSELFSEDSLPVAEIAGAEESEESEESEVFTESAEPAEPAAEERRASSQKTETPFFLRPSTAKYRAVPKMPTAIA